MKYGFRSLAVLLLAVSCAHPTSVRPSLIPLKGSITFPKDGAVFLEGTQVTFRCDAPSSEVRWFQSDLPLTSGLSCTLKMTAGSKTYRILADGQLLDEVNIKVLPLGQQSKLVFTLSGPQGVVSLPSGEFLPYIGSFSETGNNYSLGWTSLATAPLIVTNHLSRSDPLPPRPAWFPRVSVPEGLHDAKSRSIMSSRQFHFPNLGV